MGPPIFSVSTTPSRLERDTSLYQLNLGCCIDTLCADYPLLLEAEPDLSIFAEPFELHDPSGVKLRGLTQYRRLFEMLRFIRCTAMQEAEVGYRLMITDGELRVRWTAKLLMREPAFGLHPIDTPRHIHLDGTSVYELDDCALIRSHRMENIVLSGREQQPLGFASLTWPGLVTRPTPLAVPSMYSLRDR